jgi:hypothetical protein
MIVYLYIGHLIDREARDCNTGDHSISFRHTYDVLEKFSEVYPLQTQMTYTRRRLLQYSLKNGMIVVAVAQSV